MTAFLESGCGLIVGTVAADGQPYATRAWGLTVLSGDRATVRLLLDADDITAIANLSATGAIAVTAVDVPTLRSIQLKGRFLRFEDGTDADRDRAARFCEAFFTTIGQTEGTDRVLLDRLIPAGYQAGIVEVDEWFNQTPGPAAGEAIVAATP